MKVKQFITLLIPPILLNYYRTLRGYTYGRKNVELRLSGDYSSWLEAVADSTGYDAGIILKRTKAAMLKIKSGEAVYERDSVLFDEIQYSWPLLACLMWVSARFGGRLNVLDFGGSLGSTYFQNQSFLSGLREVQWNIVEQEQHVEVGKGWFENNQLKFYTDLASCLASTRPHVILLSSVLQYLPRPYDLLDELFRSPCEYFIIDRTPLWIGCEDRLCVQHVPEEIYPASYPSWIFSTQRFRSKIDSTCDVIAEFDSLDNLPGPVEFSYRGMILHRRPVV